MNEEVVVDASLAIKWVLPEGDSHKANMLLKRWTADRKGIIAPALFTYETTNIIYRQVIDRKFTYEEAKRAHTKLFSIGILLNFSQYEILSTRAMEFAREFSLLATYDAHYLALAERNSCEFWTADARLLKAVQGKLSWVRTLEDYRTGDKE